MCHQGWTAYLAIEVLLAVVASVEALTDAVAASSSTAVTDPLLLAPLAQSTTGSDGLHSTLSNSNSLAGLVRGSSNTQGSSTPRGSSAAALFAPQNSRGFTPSSSPRGSFTNMQSLAEEPAAAGVAASSAARPGIATGGGGSGISLSTLGGGGGGASTKPTRTVSVALSAPVVAAQHPGVAPLSAATVSTLVDVLWRPVLAGLSCALSHCRSRSNHESLMLVLLRGFQSYIFSAGALGEVPARDDFLKVLCEAAVTPAAMDEAGSSGSGEGPVRHPALLLVTLVMIRVGWKCSVKNKPFIRSPASPFRQGYAAAIHASCSANADMAVLCCHWSVCKVYVCLCRSPPFRCFPIQTGLRTSNASACLVNVDITLCKLHVSASPHCCLLRPGCEPAMPQLAC